MSEITIGKMRGLQQCSTRRGTIAVLALDHRNNLRHLLRPDAPDTVSDEELVAFKNLVVSYLAPAASAVLLDPQFSAAQATASRSLPGSTGLMVALEETGYTGDPAARGSQILPGWSVSKARRMGASAVKLLVYYHPDSAAAGSIEDLVRQVGNDCMAEDIPLFLEPLSYSLDPAVKRLSSAERRRVVLETARRLAPLGVDILKAEFPIDITAVKNEREWLAACQELTDICPIPWVLLSAAVDFEVYLRQVEIACAAGASGVAAGRAVWKEAPIVSGYERESFLRGLAYERMSRLSALCDALARPWTHYYTAPDFLPDWYERYSI
ncbi:MAG TPA: tagatose 1,6-diphosphate aldolase [Anaerolineaceae bacterium]|nr:tagatose 1,6-diphosphate aldolase [Anaerolineaceae bacterium]